MSYKKLFLLLFLGIFLSAERNASAQVKTLTFAYTGAMQTWTVPSCVALATVTVEGAQGGLSNECGSYYLNDEQGGIVIGTLNISPGQVLNIFVGGQGANGITASPGAAGGFNGGANGAWDPGAYGGGGGGGASDIRIGGIALTNRVVVAGGSGGEAYNYGCGTESGGSGGTLTGQCGLEDYNAECGAPGSGGGGGSQAAGGLGGTEGCVGANGALGLGGAGGNLCNNDGGGGGGGYWGGGGGVWGGGGGGSSYIAGLVTVMKDSLGGRAGNGLIIVSYVTDSVGSAQPNVINNIVCNGNATGKASVFVNHVAGISAFTYSWAPSGGTKDTATGLIAGQYTVTVQGCGTATAVVTITQPSFFTANPVVTNISCYGGVGSITAGAIGGTGPYTYVFTPGGQVNAINNLPVGSYSLNVLDNRGCASSDLITITQPNPLVVMASPTDSVVCYGQSNGGATSSVTGGTYPYTYLWSPSGGTNATANGLSAGTYVLNVTDNHGCVGSGTVPILQPAQLTVALTPTLYNLPCYGDQNGVLGSGVKGGVGPYTYLWSSNAGVDSDASGLSAGSYTLAVTDANGCVTKQSGTVTQPAPLVLSIDSTDSRGGCSGTAWVILNGGVQPYKYMWSNGSTNYYQDSLCTGLYCCTVTDNNGCVHNICTNITSDLGVNGVSANTGKITVYPNPTNGAFIVNINGVSGSAVIEVYDVLGAKVYSAALDMTTGGNTTVNLANQSNGIYLYRIISNTNGNLLSQGKVVLEK